MDIVHSLIDKVNILEHWLYETYGINALTCTRFAYQPKWGNMFKSNNETPYIVMGFIVTYRGKLSFTVKAYPYNTHISIVGLHKRPFSFKTVEEVKQFITTNYSNL